MTSQHYGMLSPPWKAHRGITPSVCVTQVWGKCYDFCVAFQESVGEEHLSGCLERWGAYEDIAGSTPMAGWIGDSQPGSHLCVVPMISGAHQPGFESQLCCPATWANLGQVT